MNGVGVTSRDNSTEFMDEKKGREPEPAFSPDAPKGASREYTGGPPAGAAPAAGAGEQTTAGLFYAPPPAVPTQEGPMGIRYDFNDGARVLLPKGTWRVRLTDEESGNILFLCDADEGWVVSARKYYVVFGITVWVRGREEPVFEHIMDLKDRAVRITFPVGTLGDMIGWFPYAEKFLHAHGCILECVMGENILELLRDQYPEICFATTETSRFSAPYASYRVGLFFGGNRDNQPIDFHMSGLHRTAGTGRLAVMAAQTLLVEVDAGWMHTYGSIKPRNTFSFAGGDTFDIIGSPLARDAFTAKIGFDVKLTPWLSLKAGYDGMFGGKTQSHGGSMTVVFEF